MLGGLEMVDKPDVIGSIVFLREFITSKALKTDLACDCGAGKILSTSLNVCRTIN